MQKVQKGEVINYVAAAAVADGDVIAVGDVVGVACCDAAVGELVALDVEGVFELATAGVFTQGAKAYWDTVNKKVVAAEGANIVALGHVWEANASGDTTVNVKIN